MKTRKRRCPHALIQDCPLYWAAHDGGGHSCDDGRLEPFSGCAVDRGASYDAIAGKITLERYANLRGMICRPMVLPGKSVRFFGIVVDGEGNA